MVAGKYDVTIEQGATWLEEFTWTDSDDVLINLTGYTAAATVKKTYGGETLITATSSGGSPTITLGGAAGTININVPHATTAAVAAQSGVWDIELTSGGGVRTRLLEGKATITPEVTTT